MKKLVVNEVNCLSLSLSLFFSIPILYTLYLCADDITKERASRSIKSNEHLGEAAEFEHRRMKEEEKEEEALRLETRRSLFR